MNKNSLNYWVDVVIGVAFVLSAVSGLIFLLPVDPVSSSGVLGISFRLWNQVHTWASLAMIAGVGAHLALHWKWIVAMTKRVLPPKNLPEMASPVCSGAVSRRRFLYLGGIAAIATGLVVASNKAIFDAGTAEASQDGHQLAGTEGATEQKGGIACPFGVVNDPYPGRCRYYTDANGDGLCDYSVPGSGSNSSSSVLGRGRGAGWRQPQENLEDLSSRE